MNNKMDRFGEIDEYDDEQRQEHTRVINTIPSEDYMTVCYDLVLCFYANFVVKPSKLFYVKDEEYNKLMQTAIELSTKMRNVAFDMNEYVIFCKSLSLMLKKLDEIDNGLVKQMEKLSVKTNTRKLGL